MISPYIASDMESIRKTLVSKCLYVGVSPDAVSAPILQTKYISAEFCQSMTTLLKSIVPKYIVTDDGITPRMPVTNWTLDLIYTAVSGSLTDRMVSMLPDLAWITAFSDILDLLILADLSDSVPSPFRTASSTAYRIKNAFWDWQQFAVFSEDWAIDAVSDNLNVTRENGVLWPKIFGQPPNETTAWPLGSVAAKSNNGTAGPFVSKGLERAGGVKIKAHLNSTSKSIPNFAKYNRTGFAPNYITGYAKSTYPDPYNPWDQAEGEAYEALIEKYGADSQEVIDFKKANFNWIIDYNVYWTMERYTIGAGVQFEYISKVDGEIQIWGLVEEPEPGQYGDQVYAPLATPGWFMFDTLDVIKGVNTYDQNIAKAVLPALTAPSITAGDIAVSVANGWKKHRVSQWKLLFLFE